MLLLEDSIGEAVRDVQEDLDSATGDVEVINSFSTSDNLFVHAGHDVLMMGNSLSATDSVSVSAGNDISMMGGYIGTDSGSTFVSAASIHMDNGAGIYGYSSVTVNANALSMDHGSTIGGYYAASVSVAGPIALDHGSRIFGSYAVSVVSAGPISLRNGSQITGNYGAVSIISGGQLSLDQSFIVGNGVNIGATGVSLDHNSFVFGYSYGNTAPANVEMVISGGDLTLNNGSHIGASNDVLLTLTGAGAEVVLNDAPGEAPSTIEAGSPTTIHIDFLSRTSGGIIIDGLPTTTTLPGGSGFFANGNPASPGNGLDITYGSPDNIASSTIDQFFNNLTDADSSDEKKKDDDTEGTNQGEKHENHTGTCS